MRPDDLITGSIAAAPGECGADTASVAEAEKHWRPAPLVIISAILHGVALLWLALVPAQWLWALAVLAGNHALLSIFVFMPRSLWLSPNLSRLPDTAARRREVGLTFDDGPDARVTPQILDLLDRYQFKASFFCLGEHVTQNPELACDIVARGHSIENHSHAHPYCFAFFGPNRLMREIQTAQSAIVAITGAHPVFFRAPMGLRSPMFLDFVLSRIGLRLVSWTRRGFDTLSSDPDAILARLIRNLAAGDIIVMHDVPGMGDRPIVLEVLPKLLEAIARENLKSVTLRQAMQ